MSRLILLAACASLSAAKIVTYNFNVGWVRVSVHSSQHAGQPHLIVARLLPMDSLDLLLALMGNGRKL
jgi:hypothetical protein